MAGETKGEWDDTTKEEILGTEFDRGFIGHMAQGLVQGYRRWGPVEKYHAMDRRGDGRPATIDSYRDDVARLVNGFEAGGSPSLLADAANYLMFLYMRATRHPETIEKQACSVK